MIKCPKCGKNEHGIKTLGKLVTVDNIVWRRMSCAYCHHVFYTMEMIVTPPKHIKNTFEKKDEKKDKLKNLKTDLNKYLNDKSVIEGLDLNKEV